MSSRLDFRLTKLERVPDAGGVDLRVFGTVAEAGADARPPWARDGGGQYRHGRCSLGVA